MFCQIGHAKLVYTILSKNLKSISAPLQSASNALLGSNFEATKHVSTTHVAKPTAPPPMTSTTPKCTAAKSKAGGNESIRKSKQSVQSDVEGGGGLTKKEYDDLRYRLKNAPEEIVNAWSEVEKLSKTNPKRQELFDAIMNVRKGCFSDVMLIITKSWSRTSGR